MGALKPWHVIILSLCCLGVTGLLAGGILMFTLQGKKKRRP